MDHFERSGLRFTVIDSGPADAETVVLLHGFPQQPSCYDGVARRLHDAGLRTLVPTQRGYSPSASPRRRRDYRTSELTGDVVALLDAAGVRAGAHRGARLGRRAGLGYGRLASRPDRLAGRTVHPASRGHGRRLPPQQPGPQVVVHGLLPAAAAARGPHPASAGEGSAGQRAAGAARQDLRLRHGRPWRHDWGAQLVPRPPLLDAGAGRPDSGADHLRLGPSRRRTEPVRRGGLPRSTSTARTSSSTWTPATGCPRPNPTRWPRRS